MQQKYVDSPIWRTKCCVKVAIMKILEPFSLRKEVLLTKTVQYPVLIASDNIQVKVLAWDLIIVLQFFLYIFFHYQRKTKMR